MSSKAEQLQKRLTDRARKILKMAESEAETLKEKVVDTEHVLMGLIKEGTGVASNVLRNLDVDLRSMEKSLKDILQSRDPSAPAPSETTPTDPEQPIAITQATNEILDAANHEANKLQHEYVGSEDLLLGLLHDTKGLAGQVLDKFGVKLEAAREEVQNLLGIDGLKKSSPAAEEESADGGIDLSEKGRGSTGVQLSLDKRLFMQFMAFRNGNRDALVDKLRENSIQAVVYQDINDAQGFGVMAYCQDPAYFIDKVQPMLAGIPQGELVQKHEFTMLGRTYSIGYENDLEDVLIQRPVKRLCDPATPWAVYYPVRRSGMFERQSKEDQRKMLMEHGGIGHAFGKAGFATDIRLAGHGLNKDDNDFIIGLLGAELFPLSAIVQRMRRTRQTAEFIDNMGPFFIGKAIWQPKFDPQIEIA